MKMKEWVRLKDLNEFAESRGYQDWAEFEYEHENDEFTIHEALKMIRRGY